MDAELAKVCRHAQKVFEFRVSGISVRFLGEDPEDGVEFEYPEHGESGWTPFEEFEDLTVEGHLPSNLILNRDIDREESWQGKPTRGWSTEKWAMRSNSTLNRTKKSLTKGIWAVHETSTGHTTTHLPSGLAVVCEIPGVRLAKKTAYALESESVLGFDKFYPDRGFSKIREAARDASLDEYLSG